MRKLNLDPELSLWVSDDMLSQYNGSRQLIWDTFQGLWSSLSSKEQQFISCYGKVNRKEKVACLHAHGFSQNSAWYYQDGTQEKRVQDWINSLKGSYKAVVLFVCNPGAYTPVCKNALLLLSDADMSVLGVRAGACNFNLVHPTAGELEYTLEYELKQLQQKIGKNPTRLA